MQINLLLKYVHSSEIKVYNCLVQKNVIYNFEGQIKIHIF